MPSKATPSPDRAWLNTALRKGARWQEALALFDRLDPLPIGALTGRWRGTGVHTGHPLDGLLERCGWYGKAFVDADAAFPLLFAKGSGAVVAVDPGRLPLRWAAHWRSGRRAVPWAFRASRFLLVTTEPSARLRLVACRGKVGAAMIYDALPIIDAFRRVGPDCLLGLMDCRYFPLPLFFALHRE